MSVPVTLEQVLVGLKQSFHSIDIRTAARKSQFGPWEVVLSGIRISSRPVEAVKHRYAQLEASLGRRHTGHCGIFWEALPFTDLDSVLSDLAKKPFDRRITLEGQEIKFEVEPLPFRDDRLPQDIEGWKRLQGRIQRHQEFVRPWYAESWPALYCSAGESSHFYHDDRTAAEIRGTLGMRSLDEMIKAFLELSEAPSSRSLKFFIFVEMPARICTIRAIGNVLTVEIVAEKNLQDFQAFLSRRDFTGITLQDNRELHFDPPDDAGPFSVYHTPIALDQAGDRDVISCVLTHEKVPEIDELTGSLREFMPPQEKNPLLECLKQFWDMGKLYQQVERPYEVLAQKVEVRPQLAFQKSVARLLNLAGFQAIDLERDDRMLHPETNVERATIDILAFHPGSEIILLGACTIYVPKAEDYDKLLHARAVLQKLFQPESPVRLVPVLFSAQESVSPFKGDAAKMGMRLINAQGLTILKKLVEKGEEDRFVYFLSSPPDAELREKGPYDF